MGEPGFAEIALRVRATPLDPVQNRDVDCAEVFGGDTSAASATVRANDNPWPNYLASPACVFLNLLFDLDVDKPLARTGDVLTYTLRGKNLSLNPQTEASVRLKFDGNDVALRGRLGQRRAGRRRGADAQLRRRRQDLPGLAQRHPGALGRVPLTAPVHRRRRRPRDQRDVRELPLDPAARARASPPRR